MDFYFEFEIIIFASSFAASCRTMQVATDWVKSLWSLERKCSNKMGRVRQRIEYSTIMNRQFRSKVTEQERELIHKGGNKTNESSTWSFSCEVGCWNVPSKPRFMLRVAWLVWLCYSAVAIPVEESGMVAELESQKPSTVIGAPKQVWIFLFV